MAKRVLDDLRVDYHVAFTSEAGMRVLEDIKQYCMWGKSPYNGMSFRDTDRNIAFQEVVMHILDMLGGSYENIQTEVLTND